MLTGEPGTGKTMVALEVANNLIQSLEADTERDKGPVLLVTLHFFAKENLLLKYLDANTSNAKTRVFEHWDDLLKGYGIDNESDHLMQLLYLTLAVDEEWEGRMLSSWWTR